MEVHKLKIVIYARKSTESEDRQILSIDSQVKELSEYAQNQNLEVAKVFTESMSAKSPGRPIFNELVSFIEKGKFNQILCWKLDRLARNPVDGGTLIWAMEKERLKNIHTPQRTFVNTGNDKFWMQLEFGMAKKYVDDLSDNVKRGMRAKLKLGWRPTIAPLGYLNDLSTKTIIKDPERFGLVRKMWDLMLGGIYTAPKIHAIATEKWGLRTRKFRKKGGKPLATSMIYDLFKNHFYYGAIGKGGECFQGSHEPMITKSEFDHVQQLLRARTHPRPKHHTFAFTGILTCGECGASITAEHKINRQGHRYIYYHCTKRKTDVSCSQKSIELKALESQILEFLNSLTISNEIKNWTIRLLKELHEEEIQKDRLSLVSLNKRLDTCSNEIAELLNMKLRGLLTDEEYVAKKSELENERSRLKQFCENSNGKFDHVLKRCEEPFEFAYFAKNRFINGTPEEKRAILSYTGSNLLFKDGILLIKAQKPLLLIKKTLESQTVKNVMFEPQFFASMKRNKADTKPGFPIWSGLVEDVRTYYWENRTNLESLKLPDILHFSGKNN